jgi:hypothetical protein
MKSVILLMAVLFSVSSHAGDTAMCADEIASYDKEKCEELMSKHTFETIPVELCQYRMSKGEMLECYEAIKDKTYDYQDILDCAATQRLGIPGCLESVGLDNTSND